MPVSHLVHTIIYIFSSSIVENLAVTDYLQEGDIGFKKPKASIFVLAYHLHCFMHPYRRKRNDLLAVFPSRPISWILQ